jgi:hypothetical protein
MIKMSLVNGDQFVTNSGQSTWLLITLTFRYQPQRKTTMAVWTFISCEHAHFNHLRVHMLRLQ